MNLTTSITKCLIRKKLAVAILLSASLAAFATSGGGNKSSTTKSATTVTLRSGYNYKSNNLLGSNNRTYITVNTNITYQRGNMTYVVPVKKKVLLDKVKFTPPPARP